MVEVFAVADLVWTALIVAIGGLATPLLIARQLNNQRKTEKAEEYKRQAEIDEKAEKVRTDLAKEDEQKREDAKQVAEVVTEAARQLALAQAKTTDATDEVARIAAERPTSGGGDDKSRNYRSSKLLAVVISHPSGYRREIYLDGIPAIGQHILLRGAEPDSQPMAVADVLWVESNGDRSPSVIVVVCPRAAGKKSGPMLKEAVSNEKERQNLEDHKDRPPKPKS